MTGRQALRRVVAGTMIILRGLAWAGEWQETIARWVLFGITGSILATAMALHWWLIPGAIVAWCLVAAAVPQSEEDDEPGEDQDDELEDEEEPEDDEPPIDSDAFRELLRDVAGGENVHLSTIRARLAKEVPGVDWHGPATTALCEAAGVRVRKGVRVAGADPAVTTGIHRDDLPPLSSPAGASPVGVVLAGQHSNNNTNTRTEHVGQGGLIVTHGPSIRQHIK